VCPSGMSFSPPSPNGWDQTDWRTSDRRHRGNLRKT
jgi:hypothetical protein